MGQIRVNQRDIVRFWQFVEVGDADACWYWTGKIATNGYGHFSLCGSSQGAHRVSYVIANGAIPVRYGVLHTCDVKHCVNPRHLFVGTQHDNNMDMSAKGRSRKSRFTASQVAEMRRLRSLGLTYYAIAHRFDCPWPTVARMIRGDNTPRSDDA